MTRAESEWGDLLKQVEYRGNGQFVLEPEAPIPTPGPSDVVVKVRYCGICGSDLHMFQNIGHAEIGQVLGHEISGTIAEVGTEIEDLHQGDRVTALCGGGYAEYVRVERERVIPLPESVSFEQAALAEPFAVGLRSVRDSGLRLGGTAGVIGAGPIGLFTMMAARLAGALNVYVAEVAPGRRAKAEELGATAVFNPKTEDAVEAVRKLEPDGLDAVFDCDGGQGTLTLALDMVKKGGDVLVVGLSGLPEELNTRSLFRSHAKIVAVPGALEVWPLSVKLIAQGRVDPSRIITDVIPLDDMPRFMHELQRPEGQVQVIVDPWGDRF